MATWLVTGASRGSDVLAALEEKGAQMLDDAAARRERSAAIHLDEPEQPGELVEPDKRPATD